MSVRPIFPLGSERAQLSVPLGYLLSLGSLICSLHSDGAAESMAVHNRRLDVRRSVQWTTTMIEATALYESSRHLELKHTGVSESRLVCSVIQAELFELLVLFLRRKHRTRAINKKNTTIAMMFSERVDSEVCCIWGDADICLYARQRYAASGTEFFTSR